MSEHTSVYHHSLAPSSRIRYDRSHIRNPVGESSHTDDRHRDNLEQNVGPFYMTIKPEEPRLTIHEPFVSLHYESIDIRNNNTDVNEVCAD